MTNREVIHDFFRLFDKIDYIRPESIPGIELYMDQVTTFMDRELANMKRTDAEKILTKTMINNYTKSGLLPPPEKKKYSRDHMFALIFIYYMKDFLSIADIKKVMNPVTDAYFHASTGTLGMEDIYREVFSLEHVEFQQLMKDVLRQLGRSKNTFQDAPESERENLQLFALFCMLGFDVYIKKMMMTYLIDHVDLRVTPEGGTDGDSEEAAG